MRAFQIQLSKVFCRAREKSSGTQGITGLKLIAIDKWSESEGFFIREKSVKHD